jgi:hypothetical protein
VYLDFAESIGPPREGSVIPRRYGNLFDMYEHHRREPVPGRCERIYPAIHYDGRALGGLI